jgi:hypothetical protein
VRIGVDRAQMLHDGAPFKLLSVYIRGSGSGDSGGSGARFCPTIQSTKPTFFFFKEHKINKTLIRAILPMIYYCELLSNVKGKSNKTDNGTVFDIVKN